MKKRNLLANEFELESRNRRLNHLAHVIKAITYLALAIIVIAMLFTDKEAQHIIVASGFILILGANLFGLYRGRKVEAYIWQSLKRGTEDNNNEA